MGKPTPEQLARINQLARTPLTEDQVYVFTSKMIGDNYIPERYQRVTPNFLQKMSQQAKDGVSLLLDHSWSNLGVMTIPIGRSFDGRLQTEPTGELALYGDFYMVRGQTLNGISTDEIISAIDAGTLFDTSVGFTISKAICDLDGEDYWGGICPHWRGDTYDGKTCTVSIDDGSLMENSLVFDGAYAGAGVVAASKAAHDHEHKSKWVPLEDAKALKNGESVLFSFSNKQGLREFVQASATTNERDDQVNELEQAKAQLSTATSMLSKVRELLGVTSDDAVEGAVNALKAKADLGTQYQTKVVEEALAAGVRAMGADFNADAFKLSFSSMPVAEVEKIRDTYNAKAVTALGGGGQHVVTQGQELPENPATNPHAQTQGENPNREALAREARESLKRNGHADKMKEAN